MLRPLATAISTEVTGQKEEYNKIIFVVFEVVPDTKKGINKMDKTWIDEHGAVFTEDKKTLLRCPDVEKYTIPDFAKQVSEHAFDTAPHLRSIDFNNVSRIPSRLFKFTEKEPYFEGTGWAGYEYETKVHYYSLFKNCPFVEEINVNDNISEIGLFAFAGLKHLTVFSTPKYYAFCPLILFSSNIRELKVNHSFVKPSFYYTSSSFIDLEGNEHERDTFRDINKCFPALETCYIKEFNLGEVIDTIAQCCSVKKIVLPESEKKRYNLQIQYVWEHF